MKATIDLDDALYRRLKVEAARRGRTVRELVAEGIRYVLDAPPAGARPAAGVAGGETAWLGVLKGYAANARGRHDLPAIRDSIARGRRRTRT